MICLTQHEDGLVSVSADMVGDGEQANQLGLEIMSSLQLAMKRGANIYVSPTLINQEMQ